MGTRTPNRARLQNATQRIEALRRRPEAVGGLWLKLKAPVLRWFGFRPTFSTGKITSLVDQVRARRTGSTGTGDPLQPVRPLSVLFEEALLELEQNVQMAELGARMRGGLAPSYRVWLRNMAAVLLRVWPVVDGSSDGWATRVAEAVGRQRFAPPLVAPDRFEGTGARAGAQRVSLLDTLLEAARQETQSLERRRRLLEAARETLIEANASLALDLQGVQLRHETIAKELVEIQRLEAAGISPHVRLTHQLREAYQRREWARLHAGFVALERMSLEGAETDGARAAHRALGAIWQGNSRFGAEAARGSCLSSVDEIFGEATKQRLAQGIAQAKEDYLGPRIAEKAKVLAAGNVEFVKRHVESLDVSLYLNGLLAVDGCFDVGGVLTPTRVVTERQRKSAVRYPTRELALLPADGPEDIPDGVIEDPRTIIPDLASGKLLARRFISDEAVQTRRTVLLGELRIYLLDGSTSMLKFRSVMRDAILIAELCTVIARLNDARRSINPTLYFQYFDRLVGDVTEISTAGQAADAIASLLATVHTGDTNIHAALLRSIEQIRAAQQRGMDLARANIVLITDGEAPIDERQIVARLDSLGELRTGINIIALGVENWSLRELAAHQRATGRRVFYQFVDDATIEKIISGERDEVCLHPPQGVEFASCSELLRETVEQIEAIDRRQVDTGNDAYLEQALGEMDEDTALREALRGRIDAINRDQAALTRRLRHWFPDPAAVSSELVYEPDRSTAARLLEVTSLLESVAEIVSLMSSDPSERQADALEIFQRGLYDIGISPLDYARLRSLFPDRFRPPMERLYEALRMNGG
jgi:hypothetical protein